MCRVNTIDGVGGRESEGLRQVPETYSDVTRGRGKGDQARKHGKAQCGASDDVDARNASDIGRRGLSAEQGLGNKSERKNLENTKIEAQKA